jgi:hypothetical protein
MTSVVFDHAAIGKRRVVGWIIILAKRIGELEDTIRRLSP